MSHHPESTRRRVAELRAKGYGYNKISRITGVPSQTVMRWVNPEYNQRQLQAARNYKYRHRRSCQRCGAPVWLSSNLCIACSRVKQHEEKYWTAERIIDAIQRWAREYGQPPVVTEWATAKRPKGYPSMGSCYGPHSPFRNWADAIEAAGFPRPVVGHKRQDRKWDHAQARALRAQGISDKRIARQLGISPATLVRHLGSTGKRQLRPVPTKDLRKRNRLERIADLRKALDADPENQAGYNGQMTGGISMPRDTSKWALVEGDHADDPSYVRIADPKADATDEVLTTEEIESYAEEADTSEVNATTGAIAAAEQLGVDLSTVSGTGADGRITKADVEAAAE